MDTYKIVRYYRDSSKKNRVMRRGLTLAQAKRYTSDPKTKKEGVYFDGYTKER